jgi:hypothetical protein
MAGKFNIAVRTILASSGTGGGVFEGDVLAAWGPEQAVAASATIADVARPSTVERFLPPTVDIVRQ